MSEAEFERRQAVAPAPALEADGVDASRPIPSRRRRGWPRRRPPRDGRGRAGRVRPAKPRRVQRMFALEEDLDKKLWLYAIHVGKDRSDVVNDLLRPVVASMVLYDSRDRRSGRAAEPAAEAEQGGSEPGPGFSSLLLLSCSCPGKQRAKGRERRIPEVRRHATGAGGPTVILPAMVAAGAARSGG